MEPIARFVEQNFGLAFLIGIIAVGGVLSGAVWLTIFLYKVITKNRDLEKKVDVLPCIEHTSNIHTHSEKIQEIGASLSRIDGKLEILLRVLPLSLQPKENILSDETPALSQKHSPRVLNDNGLIVSRVFGCEPFFNSNKEWLVSELSKFSPKTALDVETYGMLALRVASSDKRFNSIKNQVYNSAAIELNTGEGNTKKYEITLEDILFVLSLYLRDEYLALHPEINA